MDDEQYVATLLGVLTNPTPTGIDPDDPDGQAGDGIDRYGGFGSDVRVTGLRVVDRPHGDELEVRFTVALPTRDPGWEGVSDHGATRVPFDAQWRRLSELTDPVAYAREVASRVMAAARDHVALHPHGERLARVRAEWRAGARVRLPDRKTQWSLLLEAVAGEGDAIQVAQDRIELRLRSSADDDPLDDLGTDRAAAQGDFAELDVAPEVITFVLTPEEWEEVLVDQYDDDLELCLAETLAIAGPRGTVRRLRRGAPDPVDEARAGTGEG